jgi:hypothetical protein
LGARNRTGQIMKGGRIDQNIREIFAIREHDLYSRRE